MPLMWNVDIITFLPQIYPSILGESLIGKALERKNWDLNILDICNFKNGNSHHIDDTPYGGGAGMVLRPDIASKAIDTALNRLPDAKRCVIYPSPAGKPFVQSMAQHWSQTDGLIFLCGRFEGVDERIISHYNITEVSLGDFILCGGDVAAMAMIETTVRLLPDTVGDKVSLDDESFVDNLLEYPQYTRPSDWNGHRVPDVLLSGNHRAIAQWRSEQAEKRTYERRSDLWNKYCHLKKTDK